MQIAFSFAALSVHKLMTDAFDDRQNDGYSAILSTSTID